MTTHKLITKSALIIVVVLMAGVACGNIRTLLWDDPYCNTFSADGTCCITCSYHYWMDRSGKCKPVSDWCKTWQNSTGCCTSCFPGYGNPVNGVCASSPAIGGGNTGEVDTDPNCAVYSYVDESKRFYKSWFTGCKKVCTECNYGFYLNCDNLCVALPKNCEAADIYGKCTDCCEGYHVENGCCVADPEDHCAEYGYLDVSRRWNPTWTHGCKKVCKCCDFGYYLDYNYECVELSAHCTAAEPSGKCTQCEKGYHVEGDICVEDDDHCAQYGYLDASRKWWSHWATGCKKVCKCCDKGFYLTDDYTCLPLPAFCTEADGTGACTDCCEGYHVEGTICVKDDDHCAEYAYLDGSRKWWSKWTSGCKKVCKCCDQGFYLTDSYTCLALPAFCTEADGTGACTACCKGYHVEGRICVQDDDHCAEYGFLDASRKWASVWGHGCIKVCKCCDKGFYLNSKYECIALPDHCTEVDANGDCTCCEKGYHVEEGECVEDDDHCAEYGYVDSSRKWLSKWVLGCVKVCKCCDKGFYLNKESICIELSVGCSAAKADGTCTDCCEGYYLKNGICKVKSTRRNKDWTGGQHTGADYNRPYGN